MNNDVSKCLVQKSNNMSMCGCNDVMVKVLLSYMNVDRATKKKGVLYFLNMICVKLMFDLHRVMRRYPKKFFS